jgi:hypothetical protein
MVPPRFLERWEPVLLSQPAYRLAYGACKSHALGRLLKGESEPLVENGRTIRRAMARHQISHNDLLEDLRLNAGLEQTRRQGIQDSRVVTGVKAARGLVEQSSRALRDTRVME